MPCENEGRDWMQGYFYMTRSIRDCQQTSWVGSLERILLPEWLQGEHGLLTLDLTLL